MESQSPSHSQSTPKAFLTHAFTPVDNVTRGEGSPSHITASLLTGNLEEVSPLSEYASWFKLFLHKAFLHVTVACGICYSYI